MLVSEVSLLKVPLMKNSIVHLLNKDFVDLIDDIRFVLRRTVRIGWLVLRRTAASRGIAALKEAS